MHSTLRQHLRRPGHTLVELIAATSLTAIALVPTLALIRDGLSLSRGAESRELLTTYGVSKLEEHLALTAATWTTASEAGNFAADGFPEIRYQILRSDAAANGGLPGRLMSVSVTVWDDADGDDTLGAGEASSVFRSKIAKLTSYENLAAGS